VIEKNPDGRADTGFVICENAVIEPVELVNVEGNAVENAVPVIDDGAAIDRLTLNNCLAASANCCTRPSVPEPLKRGSLTARALTGFGRTISSQLDWRF
jgi:hypothetical protein